MVKRSGEQLGKPRVGVAEADLEPIASVVPRPDLAGLWLRSRRGAGMGTAVNCAVVLGLENEMGKSPSVCLFLGPLR